MLSRNIETKLKSSKNQAAIYEDIKRLQKCPTDKMFKRAVDLFVNKWNALEKDFTQFFRENYCQKTNKWCEAYSKKCPSTNNGLEATNAIIKEQKTLRERLPTNIFLAKMVEIAMNWSQRRDPNSTNVVLFHKLPEICLKYWTQGFHLAIDRSKIFLTRVIYLKKHYL